MTRTSRRRLLAGTLGSSLMAQVDAPPEVRLPRKIRLALAGFDGHPEEILRVLPQLPDVELVAVAAEESDPGAQAGALKNRYAAKARYYQTLAQLLAAEQPDVVAVCNHNGRRTAAILACAARQIDVIAEKPLALHRADLDAVYAAVRRSGIHLGMPRVSTRFTRPSGAAAFIWACCCPCVSIRPTWPCGGLYRAAPSARFCKWTRKRVTNSARTERRHRRGSANGRAKELPTRRPSGVAETRSHLRQHHPVDRHSLHRPDALGRRQALHRNRFPAIARGIPGGRRHAECHREPVSPG